MAPAPVGLAGNCRHAYLLFQDFCLLAKGARPIWVKDGATISKVLALEVIHTLLSNNTKLFEYSDEFGELLKQFVCPLVVEVLGDAEHHYNFPVYVRTMNVLRSLIVNHYKFLRIEMESLFASLLLMLSDDFISPAQAGTVASLGTLKGEVVKDTRPRLIQIPHKELTKTC